MLIENRISIKTKRRGSVKTIVSLQEQLKAQDDRISQLEKTVEQIIAVLNGEKIKAVKIKTYN